MQKLCHQLDSLHKHIEISASDHEWSRRHPRNLIVDPRDFATQRAVLDVALTPDKQECRAPSQQP